MGPFLTTSGLRTNSLRQSSLRLPPERPCRPLPCSSYTRASPVEFHSTDLSSVTWAVLTDDVFLVLFWHCNVHLEPMVRPGGTYLVTLLGGAALARVERLLGLGEESAKAIPQASFRVGVPVLDLDVVRAVCPGQILQRLEVKVGVVSSHMPLEADLTSTPSDADCSPGHSCRCARHGPCGCIEGIR